MSRLALYLLGPPRVELAGEPIHIGRTKAVALLAYLVFTAAPHRRDTLAALLWPEYDQSSARADLRRTLSILNRTLGKGWLVADRETAGLNPDEDLWLDVHAFRQRLASCQAHAHPPKELCEACVPLLEEAVELYRDDFLAGFTLRDSLAFDEWQFFQTERLKDQWASALECLVRWYAGREAYDQAIAYARRRLERDALNDAAHQELMVLFALADQQTAALRQYGLCEQILAEELGVSPSAETTALYERIRAGEDIEREPEVVVPHNLLPQSTPFVGREKELAELSDLISDPERRLVTILGPGGIGKSRLALAVAERQLVLPPSGGGERGGRTTESSFLNGVYFVPLARLSAADQITTTLADALDFRLGGGAQDSRIPRQQVLDYLREKRLLLILDNFEHLLSSPLPAGHPPRRGGTGGGASITSDILRAAPGVQMLVTSRERLQLREEHAYNLQGLAYPEDTKAADWDQYAATQLFLNTARRIQAGFKLGSDDADSLMRICQLLDGMPLGIELAAGWVDVLSLDDIATEIQRGIDFLETEWSDVPARHRSMRAAFGASWRRLTEAEKAVFAQLSVFRGGFTRQAAREVTGADLRTLARLADKSLLRFSRERERYDLHELLRQYGCERLAADTERDYATRERHSAYYCATLQVWEADLTGARCRAALAEIEADLGNVLLAWEWAVKKTDVGRLNRAVDGLGRFYQLSYRFRDGETVFEQASDALSKEDLVNVTQPSPVTGDAQHLLVKILLWRCEFKSPIGDLNVDVLLEKSRVLLNSPALADLDTRQERAVLAGLLRLISAPDWETAQRHLTESVKLFRELGKSWNMARALLLLGDVCQYLGNHDQARQMFDECLATFRTLDNYWGTFEALKQLGGWARGRCEYDQAERYLRESLALSQSKGDRLNTAIALENLGYLALFLGQAAAAADYLCDSLAIFRETGRRVLMPVNLANLSAAYWLAGEFHRARVALDKGIAMATEFEAVGANMVFVRLYAVWLDAITGDYSQARTRMHRLLTRTHGAEYGWMIAMSSGLLGWVALAEMSYKEAREAFQESIARYRSYANREYEAWSLAGLGRAEYGLGNWVEAQQHLHEALRICTDIRAFIPLLYLMPVIPVVLADENNPQLKERAVELYALATSHPFVAKAQLFEDIAGRYVRAATADLPPEVLEAAQARGRALDWWETAEELLQELDW